MTALPEGRFFDLESDCPEDFVEVLDLSGDRPLAELDLQPLRKLRHLPPIGGDYAEMARFLEANETGTPLAEGAAS